VPTVSCTRSSASVRDGITREAERWISATTSNKH